MRPLSPEQLKKIATAVKKSTRAEAIAIGEKYGLTAQDIDIIRKLVGATVCLNRKLTQEQKDAIVDEYRSNPMTRMQDLADKYNCTISNISLLLRIRGFNSNIIEARTWSIFQKKKLIVLRQKGMSYKDIAKIVNRTTEACEQKFNQLRRIGEI